MAIRGACMGAYLERGGSHDSHVGVGVGVTVSVAGRGRSDAGGAETAEARGCGEAEQMGSWVVGDEGRRVRVAVWRWRS
jgi:hypothetical protein